MLTVVDRVPAPEPAAAYEVYLPPTLMSAIARAAQDSGRTIDEEIRLGLLARLRAAGYWPPRTESRG